MVRVRRPMSLQVRAGNTVTGPQALTAGITLVLVSLLVTGAGIWIGSALGATVAGGCAGGVLGILLGFRVVWKVYVVPLRTEMLRHDRSHLQPQWNEDD